MQAFLLTPRAPALNVPGVRASKICSRRPTPSRQPARVHFSATIDEAPPIDGLAAPAPRPPPRRPQPNTPPQRPAAYPSRGERPRPSGDGRGAPRPPFVADPNATYYTKCGSCQAAYELKPEILGTRGKKVGCAVCGNEWFQKADRLMSLRDKQEFKEYPREEKDRLIEEQQARRERFRARKDDGDSRGGPRRDGAREGQGARRGGSRNYAQHSLFIGNLPFSVTQEELEQVVADTVETTRVAIIRDPETGRSKGFAFADLKSEADVETAVNLLNGKELGGRTITVRVGRKN